MSTVSPGEELRRKSRSAFQRVIDTYNSIRSVMGTTKAMDYSTINRGAQGPQYSFNDEWYRLIDFTVDVRRAATDSLTPAEMAEFDNNIQDQEIDYTVQSNEFVKFQEKLGRVFVARKLYPTSKYFAVIKR